MCVRVRLQPSMVMVLIVHTIEHWLQFGRKSVTPPLTWDTTTG